MIIARETEYVEFKESLSQLSRSVESIAAMLNKHGNAIVYFGVRDNGDIIGVNIGNKTLKDISQMIAEKVKPTIVPHITEEVYGDKVIIIVKVSGSNTPYSADGNFYIRSGNENRKLDPETLRSLVFKNTSDNMVNIESSNQDLTFNQLWQLYILKGLTVNKNTFAKNMGLLTKDGKYNLLANMLSDNSDFSIKVVRFNGLDKTEIISRNEFGYKCLILAFQLAFDYTCSFNETIVDMSSMVRKDIKLFDEPSLREAWINACLHTRWERMVPPAIYIFDDRIEIVSTGGLPIDYSLDAFYEGISHPINIQLQKIMGQLGIVEQTGHGVPEILKHYGKDAFDISDNNIRVTLKFPFELNRGANDFSKLTASQVKVLKAIINQPSITISDLSKITELGSSRISSILKELKSLNKISRVGSNKNGYWEVIK